MISEFQGKYRFLSNFWPAPIELDGLLYPTVEHAYQAAKTEDVAARERISCLITAGEAKRAGRGVNMRAGWDAMKIDIMRDLVAKKFQIPTLRDQLLATGSDELIEGNRWGDTFWGQCNGRGENHLGKILMAIRAEAQR